MTTKTVKTHAQGAQVLRKDLTRMAKLMATYAELKREADTLSASLKAAETEILDLATRHPGAFDADNRLVFEPHGYIRVAEKIELRYANDFNVETFRQVFPEAVKTKHEVSVAWAKNALSSADARPAVVGYGLDMVITTSPKIELKMPKK